MNSPGTGSKDRTSYSRDLPVKPADAQAHGHLAGDKPVTIDDLREALRALIAECDKANAAAILQLGGIVIDLEPINRAREALAGERIYWFCAGYRNVLRPLVPPHPPLEWESDKAGGVL